MNLSFARDIRPLFTDQDVAHMSYIFDLSEYGDVKANAELIYERLEDQSMPPANPGLRTRSRSSGIGSTRA